MRAYRKFSEWFVSHLEHERVSLLPDWIFLSGLRGTRIASDLIRGFVARPTDVRNGNRLWSLIVFGNSRALALATVKFARCKSKQLAVFSRDAICHRCGFVSKQAADFLNIGPEIWATPRNRSFLIYGTYIGRIVILFASGANNSSRRGISSLEAVEIEFLLNLNHEDAIGN